MKKEAAITSSRRRFLSFGLLGATGLMATKATAGSIPENDEKIPMLTADGKLVEISKTAFHQSIQRKKAKNADVLDWRKGDNTYNK